jgi:DNA-binding IclR family transcriptional regulator
MSCEDAACRMDRSNQRDGGYCLSRGMVTRGVGVVGMMLPTRPNHRRLAIGVAGPQERIDRNLTRILTAFRAEKRV